MSPAATFREIWAPWTFCAQAPGAIAHPDQLNDAPWLPAIVPGTVASSLAALGRWNLDRPLDADGQDWWYRTTFSVPQLKDRQTCHLCFDGLATLAEVWLNGERVLLADNMFRRYRLDVSTRLLTHNELVLGFRSLTQALAQKQPRPRWKTNLVAQQQMRWRRTTLLGRIPGWSPPVPPVGPWRDVRLECGVMLASDVRLRTSLEKDVGVVHFQCRIHVRHSIEKATLTIGLLSPSPPGTPGGEGRGEGGRNLAQNIGFSASAIPPSPPTPLPRSTGGEGRPAASLGTHGAAANCQKDGDAVIVRATVEVPDPQLWWPHTHGEQPLFDCSLTVDCGDERLTIPCGQVAFRQIEISNDRFALRVNGAPIYCRGACWTVSDINALDGTPEALAHDLRLARDAGANMLRIGGTMIYESDPFYRLCDELGIMVWQDFMFANMDYPVEDPGFAANIESEAIETIARLASHPSVVVYCGNSEVEQQAAMLGMPEDAWRNRWFGERLPALCAEQHPSAVYVPSTPSGGTLPFHVRQGVAHYYGIGAYQRTPADLRKDDVGFTSECLGFANIPEQATLVEWCGGDVPMAHQPRWKERVPRDTGAGWDFDDVRDFYCAHLFHVDPVRLRSFDPDRYLRLSRIVPGEMMAQAYSEWRGAHSRNAGALVWFFKDLWPGPGYGIVDSWGRPKPAYYALRRVWQPRQILITDEGLDGLHVHVINETAEPFRGCVELALLKDGHIVIARQEVACDAAPRSRQTLAADAILKGFYDVAYAYRFGPPKHDVAIATLLDEQQHAVSEAHHFPMRRAPIDAADVSLTAQAERLSDRCWQTTLRTDRFLDSVSFDVKGFRAADSYFHLSPLRPKTVRLTATALAAGKLSGYVDALNLKSPVRIAVAARAAAPSAGLDWADENH